MKKAIGAGITLALMTGVSVCHRQAHEAERESELTLIIQQLRRSAASGNVADQFDLGSRYAQGLGVPKNYTEALRWLTESAEAGNPRAQYSLAYLYSEGIGVAQDYAVALRWAHAASDRGDAMGQFALGISYAEGLGVKQDHGESARWLRRSAELGYAPAQARLGKMYLVGRGVPKETTEAVRWLRKAAEQSDTDANLALAECYERGQGVGQDFDHAMHWYRAASSQGDTRALQGLRTMYRDGRVMKGTRWITLALVAVLILPIVILPKRIWGSVEWLPWILVSAGCGVMILRELLPLGLSPGLLVTNIKGLWRADVGSAIWVVGLMLVSVSCLAYSAWLASNSRARRSSAESI